MSIFVENIDISLIFSLREAEDASRLVALRSAVKVGIADFGQGQFMTFDTSEALGAYLNSVASKAITAA
jgi:antitoxin ParD1/3/4